MEADNGPEDNEFVPGLGNYSDNYYPYYYDYDDYNDSYPMYPDVDYDPEVVKEFHNKWQAVFKINFVAVFIVAGLGVVFNSITIAVVSHSKTLIKTRAGQYLLALAIADCMYLVFALVRMQNEADNTAWNMRSKFLSKSNALCVSTKIITFTGKLASAWLTVAIATDRFVSIKFPLKGILKNTTFTKFLIVAIFLASLGLNLSYIAVFGVSKDGKCTIVDKKYYSIVNWVVHRVFSLILPASLLFVLTSLTVYCLWRAKRVRSRLSSVRSTQQVTTRNMSTEGRLTWMLIAVSVAFLVLRVPATISYEVYSQRDQLTVEDLNAPTLEYHLSMHAAYYTLDIFDTLNYAVNFFLYCICGKVFRNALVALMTCQSDARRRSSQFQHLKSQRNRSEIQTTQLTIVSGYHMSQESTCV